MAPRYDHPGDTGSLIGVLHDDDHTRAFDRRSWHACVIEGVTYRFGVRWAAAEELAEPAFAHVLLQVHVTVAIIPTAGRSPGCPSRLRSGSLRSPRLLTDALRECLKSRRSTS
jgi:hypothetical protein